MKIHKWSITHIFGVWCMLPEQSLIIFPYVEILIDPRNYKCFKLLMWHESMHMRWVWGFWPCPCTSFTCQAVTHHKACIFFAQCEVRCSQYLTALDRNANPHTATTFTEHLQGLTVSSSTLFGTNRSFHFSQDCRCLYQFFSKPFRTYKPFPLPVLNDSVGMKV